MNADNCRILANGITVSNDTWSTHLNNNDLIIGPSGAGKTRGYVLPNLLQCTGSYVVADTKGDLVHKVGPIMAQNGYRVILVDFRNLKISYGYNPLDHIRWDEELHQYNEQDILTVADTVVPVLTERDPFWENAARMYLAALISYVLECLPQEEHTLKHVTELVYEFHTGIARKLLQELAEVKPDCLAARNYRLFANNTTSEKTEASIVAILSEKLNGMTVAGAVRMFTREHRIDFRTLGQEKTVVFLNISDTDRSMDRLVSLFYTQALQGLCRSADEDYPDNRLPIPVRIILDDFATNAYIPDFDNITSVIRSREISVSIILQSITQLKSLYHDARAQTIINNCDNCLYLGGQDVDTARYISVKANRTPDSILNMPLDAAYLFTRGTPPRKVRPYDLTQHPLYHLLPEARRRESDFLSPAPPQSASDQPQSQT